MTAPVYNKKLKVSGGQKSKIEQVWNTFRAIRLVLSLALRYSKTLTFFRLVVSLILAWIPLEGLKQTANLVKLYKDEDWVEAAKGNYQFFLGAILVWTLYNSGLNPVVSLRQFFDKIISRRFRFELWEVFYRHRITVEPILTLSDTDRKNSLELAEQGIEEAGDIWDKFWDILDPTFKSLFAFWYLFGASAFYATLLLLAIVIEGVAKLFFAFLKNDYQKKHAPYKRMLNWLWVRLRDLHSVAGIRGCSKEEVTLANVKASYGLINSDLTFLDLFNLLIKVVGEILVAVAMFFFAKNECGKALEDISYLPTMLFILPTMLAGIKTFSALFSRSTNLVHNSYAVSYLIDCLGENGAGLPSEEIFKLPSATSIVFCDVSINRGSVALDDLNFEFKSSGVNLVFGSNGAGKSTLIQVAMGLLKSQSGEVLVGGKSLTTCRLGEVGYVQPEQLHGALSFAEMMTGTDQFSPSEEELVKEALSTWGVLDVVMSFPRGIKSCVSEDGVGLSSGQLKKISLACAFYGQKSFIFLDEPFALLDEEGIKILLNQIRLRRGIATIVIGVQESDISLLDVPIDGKLSLANGHTFFSNMSS